MTLIIIHEFSTGIEIFGTRNNWSIGGFTGNYLNSTFSSVPTSVQNAISSKWFAVAEGASSDKPAVIGREIIGNDGEFSVVATVIKGIEKNRRSASLYRYFVCPEKGKIGYILQWMYQEKGGILVFDPFDDQSIDYPHKYQTNSLNPINLRFELESLLLNNSLPIIVPHNEACPPKILNQMANNCESPISWACDVQAVVKPNSFQLIKPIDRQSESIIKRAIDTTPKLPQVVIEEKSITTAIKGLIAREKLKIEHLSTIENNLDNVQINDKYWEHLFSQQGAKDAIRDRTYSPQMIRLLTLQAMVLPETLPKFLFWIQQSNNQEYYDVSTTFQNQILQDIKPYNFPRLENKLYEGVIFLIPKLVQQPKLVDVTVRLLKKGNGVWSHLYKKKVIPVIDADLTLIDRTDRTKQSQIELNILSTPAWKDIYNGLTPYWQKYANKYLIEEWQSIAGFFGNLVSKDYKELQIHALFSYISQGKITKRLYSQLDLNKKNLNKTKVKVYGIWLEREVSISEKILKNTIEFVQWLWNTKIPVPLLLPLLAVTVLPLFLTIKHFNILPSFKKINNPLSIINSLLKTNNPGVAKEDESTGVATSEGQKTDNDDSSITLVKKKEALNNFNKTKELIKIEIYDRLNSKFIDQQNIYKELNKPEVVNREVIKAIKKVLDPENKLNLQYDKVFKEDFSSSNKKEVENWIIAIYSYQQKISIKPDGYLSEGGETINKMKEDVNNIVDSSSIKLFNTGKETEQPSGE